MSSIEGEKYQKALSYLLLKYIKNWDGWNENKVEFVHGKLDIETWFKKFEEYAQEKMNSLLKNTLPLVERELELESKEKNYSLKVRGPPTILSNLAFSSNEGKINVELHTSRTWVDLEEVALLNYPHIEVEFNSGFLHFKRSFEPQIHRNLSDNTQFSLTNSKFVVSRPMLKPGETVPDSVSSDFLLTFLDAYKKIFLENENFKNAYEILNQFHQDIFDLKASERVIKHGKFKFNIGFGAYQRNKKITSKFRSGRNSNPDVIYNELIKPVAVFELEKIKHELFFNANSSVSSSFLKIVYRCTFCKLKFLGKEANLRMKKHLELKHQREMPVVCYYCRKSSEIDELAKKRWACDCRRSMDISLA